MTYFTHYTSSRNDDKKSLNDIKFKDHLTNMDFSTYKRNNSIKTVDNPEATIDNTQSSSWFSNYDVPEKLKQSLSTSTSNG